MSFSPWSLWCPTLALVTHSSLCLFVFHVWDPHSFPARRAVFGAFAPLLLRLSFRGSGMSSAHYNLPTTSLCQRHKVDMFTYRPTELIHKQAKVKEGGDEVMSASQSNKPPARLPAKHSLFFSLLFRL